MKGVASEILVRTTRHFCDVHFKTSGMKQETASTPRGGGAEKTYIYMYVYVYIYIYIDI